MNAIRPDAAQVMWALFCASAAASVGAVSIGMLIAAFEGGMGAFTMLPFALLAIFYGLIVTLPHAFLIGLPAYLLVRAAGHLNAWSAGLAGSVIGLGPVALLTIAYAHSVEWLELLQINAVGIAIFGGAGLLGGLAFHRALPRAEARA